MELTRRLNRLISDPATVRYHFSCGQIRSQLAEKKLKPQFILGVHNIKGLSVEKFEGLLSLLSALEHRIISAGMTMTENNKWKLKMPSAGELQNVDFDKLLANDSAKERVFQSCVFTNGSVINLRYLGGIWDDIIKNPNV